MIALLCALALAGDADDLLAKVDEASNRGADAHLVLHISTTETGGAPAERTLELWQQGSDKRLVRFTEPARLAGVGLLVLEDTVWLYLPSYGRVRRVIGEARGDAFLGTDFAIEDLSRLEWATEYTPELVAPLHLRLTPKEGVKASSARVDVVVRDGVFLPERVEHFDAAGTLVRRIAFDDVRDVDGRPLSHAIVVDDVGRSRTTKASVVTAAFGAGVDPDRFTISSLQE